MVASTSNFQIRRIPTYLKHLVEQRARADGQVQRLEAAIEDIRAEQARVLAHRDACDALIINFRGLNPNDIIAIRGWLGVRGGRGRLVAAINELIRRAGPTGISTGDLTNQLMDCFDLDLTPAERAKWRANNVRPRLAELKRRGDIEAMVLNPVSTANQRWRMPEHSIGCLANLTDSALALGVQVEVADDRTPDDTHSHA